MFKDLFLLFINTFSISMTANSGYAMLGVMKSRFVDRYGWLSKEEMEDYIALAQSSPGPIAVNISMLTGYHIAGICGAFSAVLGVILPPFVMMIIVTLFYNVISDHPYVRIFINGMQAGVCAMLMDVLISLFTGIMKKNSVLYFFLMIVSFLYVRFTSFSIFYLTLFCIAAAVFKVICTGKKVKENG